MKSTRIARLVRFALVGATAVLALMQVTPSGAQGRGPSNFDHLRTGFPLTGAHAVTPCETCHVGGQMANTPRRCEYCHRMGSRIATTVMPMRHIQTGEPCETCHRSAISWSGARFSHVAVTPGTCQSCHNGGMVSGKPSRHILTTASCDACHRTVAWAPAGYNHVGVVPGTCANCHGTSATGKPSGHVVTTASCDQCHRTTGWLPAGYDHTGVVAGTCGNCHRPGGSGLAEPGNHVPYQTQLLNGASMSCDACHSSTTTFSAQRMNHNGSQGNGAGWCKGCHASGTNYLGNMQKKALTDTASVYCPFSSLCLWHSNEGYTLTTRSFKKLRPTFPERFRRI